MRKRRVAILISGRGSNMTALLDAMDADDFPAEPVLVLSNRPGAAGLESASRRGVPTAAVDHKTFDDRESFEREMHARLDAAGADLVCLAGFMRVLTPWLVERWEGRMINIHPSLLPLYPGLHTHRRALVAGDKTHGCTVHFVSTGVDEGPVIGQASVAVEQGDDEDALAAKVLVEEHVLYPRCLREVCETLAAAVT